MMRKRTKRVAPFVPLAYATADYLTFLYCGPKFAQARKSADSLSEPNAFHAAGRKTSFAGTLCMQTGIRRIEQSVMRSAPT